MRRLGVVASVLIVPVLCAAQMMSSHPQIGANPHAGMGSGHGTTPSSRTVFGKRCGIADVSPQSAVVLSHSPEGKWSVLSGDKPGGPNDNAVARVWRESNWMVDLHDAPGDGRTIHTGQMCFDAKGQLTHMIDRYMDTPGCGCMRYTSLNVDTNGKVQQEQKFVKVDTGAEIATPAAAKGFPDVFGYRKLDQLPFYSIVKQ